MSKLQTNSTAIAGSSPVPCSPSSIYLQWQGDSDDCDEPVPEESLEFVTWCEDKVFDHDVRYVRGDLADEMRAIIYEVSTGGYTPMQAHEWLKSHPENAIALLPATPEA